MGVLMKAPPVSGVKEKPPQDQVFINFRGEELRWNFVSHLSKALRSANINVYLDTTERRGHQIEILLKRIEESRIALAIFSPRYTESHWCVKELDKIMDCTDEGSLVTIPIFYKVEPSEVELLEGDFGYKFKRLADGNPMEEKWAAAFKFVSNIMGITVDEKSDECEKIVEIVEAVNTALWEGIPKDAMEPLRNLDAAAKPPRYFDAAVEPLGNLNAAVEPLGVPNAAVEPSENINDALNLQTFGNKQRLKGLFDLLDKYEETRIVGVVGMPGIGKTTLLEEFNDICKARFSRRSFIKDIRLKFKDFDLDCLLRMILSELNASNLLDDVEDCYRALQKRKVLVILDDVSKREQIEVLREILKRTAKGSRGIIATNDMSLTYGQVDDIYMVPNLNYTDSLHLFHYHAFLNDQANPSKIDFMKLSEGFVHYAKGHPRALTILGRELNKKNIKLWNSKLEELAQSPSHSIIGSVFQVSYDDLTSEQQDAFLDIAYFRSHYKDYVESLLASSETGSAEARSILKALSDKFLISNCDGRVEMHDLLYNFSRELDLKASTQNGSRQRRLWRHYDIIEEHKRSINVLRNKVGASNVRGIFLDLAEVKRETHLDCEHLINMCNLRYLKVYNSHCPQECKPKSKINISDDLNLPLKEVRCLHWLKFPLKELPEDFNPINLVDLKLTYSMIKQLWDPAKDTPVLKLVDLNHSSELINLSGLSKARNLQRLNLEGCTSLESLGDLNLISLKTLILSNCSSLKEFPVNPTNLEALYLDGTAISQLPDNMVNLQRLVLLNMKDCKMLENIPSCVGELKALHKLVLSGCLKLKAFPEINESSLKILLLDGTSIQTMPQLPSVQYLCLSRNPQISYLPAGINKLSQLNRLELMYCTSLKIVPELPPNLQYLAAHGCMNLGQAAKEEITSYAQRKCQLPSYARKHYNEGLSSEALFSACFPGFEVPPWFCYEAVGSLLERKLPPHWHEKKLCGIVLCAVVQILDGQDQISCFSVTCTFKIKDEDKSWIPFTCPVGSWTRNGDKREKMTRHGDKEENTDPHHVFITYITCPHTIRILEDKNSNECNFTESSLEFTVTVGASVIRNFKVSRCGFNLVYER